MTEDTLTLRHPKLLSLYAFWLEQGGSGGPPVAAALDPAVLRPWLGNLLVMDVRQDEGFICTYSGQSLTDAFGDRVGQPLSALPEGQRDALCTECERVRETRAPAARLHTAGFGESLETWEWLVLPLSDEGEAVTKLLVGAYRLDRAGPPQAGAPRQP